MGSGARLNRRVQVTRGPRLEIIISKFQFLPKILYFPYFINRVSFRWLAVPLSFSQLYFFLRVIEK